MTELFSFTDNTSVLITKDNPELIFVDVGELLAPYNLPFLEEGYYVGIHFQVEACRAFVRLPSLLEADYPNIAPEDTLPEKMAKTADIQAQYPWISLELYRQKNGANSDKFYIAEIPFQNKRGQPTYANLLSPFLGTGPVKLLGRKDRLIGKLNLNNQILGDDDFIQIETDFACGIEGFARATAFGTNSQLYSNPGEYSQPTPHIINNDAKEIVSRHATPQYIILHNDGPSSVYLNLGGIATAFTYHLTIPSGGNVMHWRVGLQSLSAICPSGDATVRVAIAPEE